MNLILFILISFGLTQILIYGSIFNKIRPKNKLFHCSMCMGTWVGFLMFVIFWLSDIKLFPNLYFGIPLFGFLSSGTTWLLDQIVDDWGINVKINKE